ncbi:MAG: redoxin domain-containing protein [Nitrospiraceae bacterium]
MKRNGMYALHFHSPALIGGRLTYLHGRQFAGRVIALCFLPYAGLLSVGEIDRHAARFQQIGAALLIVDSSARPLHRVWVDQPEKPSTPILADPCGRLHRSFGVAVMQSTPRCRTFVIDRAGILRLRVSHDFVDAGLEVLRRIVGLDHIHASHSMAAGEDTMDAATECVRA